MRSMIDTAHARPRLRRLVMGGSLGAALALLQVFTPAGSLAQDVVEPAPVVEPIPGLGADPALDPAAPATDPAAPAVEPAAATATIWYVNGKGGSDGNCNSAGAPCRTIQAAIERAASGDTILVAGSGGGGTAYTFAGASPCTNGLGANVVVCVGNKRLVMRGGFPSNFNGYAPATNLTIIDGQGQNRGIAVLGFGNAGGTALDIAGFTVRNGYGTGISKRSGADNYFGFGGGMLVEEVSAVTMKDMVFDANRAVGGNRSSGEGGAGAGGALSFRASTASLSNVRFTNNQALGGSGATRGGYAQGGAIFTFGTTFGGSNLWFENNIARAGNTGGSGLAPDGQRADGLGGAASFSQGSRITLNGVTVRTNQAIGGNGTTYAGGAFGGGLFGEEADITINGADVLANLARGGTGENGWIGSGGGVMVIHSTLNVNRTRVLANTADGGNGRSGKWGVPNGGGITVSWVAGSRASRFTLANSFIAGNKALRGQGAQIEYGGGGGLWIQATEATVEHNTIADNQLGSGPGLYGQGVLLINTGGRGANVTFRNNLITGHSGGAGSAVEVFSSNAATFAGGLFFNNQWNTSQGNPNQGNNIGTVNGLNTVSTADPRYVSPGASNWNYHIQADSPARDKGTGSQQTVDIDGQARSDGRPDYGADEYGQPSGGGGGGGGQGLPPGNRRVFLPRIGK